MMRAAPVLMLASLLGSCGDPPTLARDSAPRGAIALEISPSSVDFGSAMQGASLTRTIALVNRGAAAVQIERIATTCGCVVTVAEDRELRPGESVDVSVRLGTKGLHGLVQKMASVYLKGESEPAARLTVRAKVQREVEVEPSELVLEPRVLAQMPPLRVALHRSDGAPLKITSIESPDPYLKAELHRDGDDHSRAQVELKVSPDTPLGWRICGDLVVSVEGPRPHAVRVPVRLQRSTGIVVEPADRVVFRDLAPDAGASETVQIQVRPQISALRALKATVELRGLRARTPCAAEVLELVPGREFEVVVRLPPPLAPGVFSGTLTLQGVSDSTWTEELLIWGTVRSDRPLTSAHHKE